MTNTQSNTQEHKNPDQAKPSQAPQQDQSTPRTPSESAPQQQK